MSRYHWRLMVVEGINKEDTVVKLADREEGGGAW